MWRTAAPCRVALSATSAGLAAGYKQALTLYRQGGESLSEANVLHELGRMLLGTPEEEKGLELLEAARQLHESIGNQSGLANVGIALASHSAAKGDLQAAIGYMQPVADFGKRIGHPLGDQKQALIDEWRRQLENQ